MTDPEVTAAPGPPTAPPAREPTVLSRPYRSLTLGIISVVLLIAFEAIAVGTAMPVAADRLDGMSLYAFAFSAFFTTSLVAMVVSGQWADRHGPLPPLTTGIASFATGLVLAGAAQGMWVFVLGRAVQGIGGGLVIVALYVAVSRVYPERLRPTVMAAFAASWVLPSIVGPFVSGLVTERLGWRWVFLGIPVLVILPVLVMLPALRASAAGPPPGAPATLDRRRLRFAVAASAGAALLQYAGQDLRPLSLVPAVLGAALLGPAALRLLPRGTFRAGRGLPTAVLMRGLASGSFVAAESFVPLMLVSQRGLTVTQAGALLAVGGTSWALGSYTQSRTALEPHRVVLVRTGMTLVTAAIGFAPLLLLDAVPVWSIALAWTVGCYGMGMVISSTSVLTLQYSRPEETGTNAAALQVCDGLANILLLAAGGAAFAALGGGSVSVPGAQADGAAGDGQPVAFVTVYVLAAAVAALGALAAGRLRATAH